METPEARATRSRVSSPAQQQQPTGQQDEGTNGHSVGNVDEQRRMEDNQVAVMSNKQQSIRSWLEPSIENKSSSEQAGFAKAGVLGGMAALGDLPKPPRKNGENGHPKTRIILRQSNKDSAAASPRNPASPAPRTPDLGGTTRPAGLTTSAFPLATAATPEISTPEPHAFPDSPSHGFPASAPIRAPARKALPMHENGEEDEEYDPKQANRRKSMPKPAPPKRGRPPSTMRRSSLPPAARPSPARQTRPETPPAPLAVHAVEPVQAQPIVTHPVQPVEPVEPIQPIQQPVHAVQSVSILPAVPNYQPQGSEFAEMVVEAAVDEALTHNRFPTAWALRTLYDTKAGEPGFVLMVERVFSQTADAATLMEFAKLLKEKKREGKAENTGREYFFPPDPDVKEERLPKPAPYARFLHRNHPAAPASHTTATAPDPSQAPAPPPQQQEGEVPRKKLKLTHKSQESTPRKMNATPGANGARTPGSRKRARRHSGSSASSLSSIGGLESPELPETSELIPPAGIHGLAQPSFRDDASKAVGTKAKAKAGAATGPQSPSQSGTRPMNTRRKSTKPQQQHQFVSNAFGSKSESPTTSLSPALDLPPSANFKTPGAMPGRITASAEQQLLAKEKAGASATKGATQPQTTSAELSEAWIRRRGAQKVTNGYQAFESSARFEDDARETTPMRAARRTRQSVLPARATRSANKRVTDEVERYDSPGAFSLSAQGDGSSVVGSRAVTPTNFRPLKKQKTGLRIKSSPVKKKGGTAAGVPRTMGDAQSFVFNGPNKEQADNDEYCSACGNSGDVLCCDGCPRSFHFECVDMVQNQASDLPEDWYCNECIVKRWPSRVPVHKGVFGGPLNQLEKSIPRAFSLPKRLQNRFDGVRAGTDGDYEEISATKAATRRAKNGYEDNTDFYKQREDGEAVLCHDCQKSAVEGRPIISCSACPLYWHIDCLDPPLAVPPPVKTWKCPAHADELLQEKPPLAPAHRYRKIKGAQVITPAVSRGLKNNGHIELDWGSEPEDDDDDNSGWRDMASFGRTYKVSAKGVRLDFIEQLRKQGAGSAPSKESLSREEPYLTPPSEDAVPHREIRAAGEERNVDEMQASLVLASLKQSPPSALDQLVFALLASASPGAIALIARGDTSNIARDTLGDQDKVSLMALLEEVNSIGGRIRERLKEDSEVQPEAGNQEPVATAEEKPGLAEDKMDTEPLVTEPTPPSTIDHEGAMDFE